MNQAEALPSGNEASTFVVGFWGVRCQVKDVARAVAFYTDPLASTWINRICRHSAKCRSGLSCRARCSSQPHENESHCFPLTG